MLLNILENIIFDTFLFLIFIVAYSVVDVPTFRVELTFSSGKCTIKGV